MNISLFIGTFVYRKRHICINWDSFGSFQYFILIHVSFICFDLRLPSFALLSSVLLCMYAYSYAFLTHPLFLSRSFYMCMFVCMCSLQTPNLTTDKIAITKRGVHQNCCFQAFKDEVTAPSPLILNFIDLIGSGRPVFQLHLEFANYRKHCTL